MLQQSSGLTTGDIAGYAYYSPVAPFTNMV